MAGDRHGLGVPEGPFVHGPRPAAPPSSPVGGLQAGAAVLDDQLPLEPVERRGHVEEEPSLGRARVDVPRQDPERDVAPFEPGRAGRSRKNPEIEVCSATTFLMD